MEWNKIKCKIFGHMMETPFNNSIPTNRCVRCGFENDHYKKDGYYRLHPYS